MAARPRRINTCTCFMKHSSPTIPSLSIRRSRAKASEFSYAGGKNRQVLKTHYCIEMERKDRWHPAVMSVREKECWSGLCCFVHAILH